MSAENSISAVFLTALPMLSIIIKATKYPLYFSEYDRRTRVTSKMAVEGISCYKAETGNGETKLLILFKERGNEGTYLSPGENSSYK